jgi:hypothetical protein
MEYYTAEEFMDILRQAINIFDVAKEKYEDPLALMVINSTEIGLKALLEKIEHGLVKING